MIKNPDKVAPITNVELHSDYVKAIVKIGKIYDKALAEILESPVCCEGSAELKIIAQNAVVKAAKIGQSVKSKIKQN